MILQTDSQNELIRLMLIFKDANLKFIRSYISGMKSLLYGNDYKRSYNGLSSAIGTISNKNKSIQRNWQFEEEGY